jgi:hypothetical protein
LMVGSYTEGFFRGSCADLGDIGLLSWYGGDLTILIVYLRV